MDQPPSPSTRRGAPDGPLLDSISRQAFNDHVSYNSGYGTPPSVTRVDGDDASEDQPAASSDCDASSVYDESAAAQSDHRERITPR